MVNNWKKNAKIAGEALLYSGISIGWASALMSSRWSVVNFSDTPEKLNGAKDALHSYLFIGSIWALGTALLMGAQHSNGDETKFSTKAFAAGTLANIGMMAYIWWTYNKAFDEAKIRHNLQLNAYTPQDSSTVGYSDGIQSRYYIRYPALARDE